MDDYCISASEINGEMTELVRKMIVVGLWCIQVIPTDRPTMTRVVEMLEGSTSNLELPPKSDPDLKINNMLLNAIDYSQCCPRANMSCSLHNLRHSSKCVFGL